MQSTANYGLKKPDETDNYDIANENANMDAIDAQMKTNADALSGKAAQSDMTAAQAAIAANVTALQGKAALSSSVSATLTAAGWAGSAAPYTQTVAVAGLGANQNGHTQIADGTTPAQRAAARYANMAKTAQAAGSITITADGTKPSIDIPITIVLEG